jgi:alkylation response protein AidB-like acyl-CoA dehydrogenase
VNLNPSPDQKAIIAAVQELMKRESARGWGAGTDRTVATATVGDALWRQCAELGWFGLAAEEAVGGVGLGLPEEVLLFREVGRFLMPGPVLGTVLGAHAVARLGHPDLAAALVGGDLRAGWRVGSHGLDAGPGDLVVGLDGDDVVVETVAAADALEGVDPSVRLVGLAGTTLVGRVDAPDLVVRARVLIAAQMLGIAEAVRDQSTEYAKSRMQFGSPIGVHQAVKHRCADQMIRCWSTRAQLFLAALLHEESRPEAELTAASAVVLALEAARLNVAANVHIHGGIGVTSEHVAGRYVKRAHVLERALGDTGSLVRTLLTARPVPAEETRS